MRTLETRQGMQTGCPEEIVFENGWIDSATLQARAAQFEKNDYGKYLMALTKDGGLVSSQQPYSLGSGCIDFGLAR